MVCLKKKTTRSIFSVISKNAFNNPWHL